MLYFINFTFLRGNQIQSEENFCFRAFGYLHAADPDTTVKEILATSALIRLVAFLSDSLSVTQEV